jgi:FtsH-binding integral membrane protein
MRLSTLLLVAGVLALVFGLGFLLGPGALLPMYGIQPDPATILMARFFGAALTHLGIALYLVREVRDPATQRGLVLAGVVGSALGLVVALMGRLSGVVNVLGWSTVLIYGLLLLGYASHLRTRPVHA